MSDETETKEVEKNIYIYLEKYILNTILMISVL